LPGIPSAPNDFVLFGIFRNMNERYTVVMRVLVTAGPTREYIDSVRFITNASSGQMGCAVARSAAQRGHEVTLLLGEGISSPGECEVVRFVTVDDLGRELSSRFERCDALVMAAAVGDFRAERKSEKKLSRNSGPVTLTLVPVEDLLADLGRRKREDQKIVAFAVEDASEDQTEAGGRGKLIRKNADYIVVNTPRAIAAESSRACILSPAGVVLPWAHRRKVQLAEEIVDLL